LSKITRVKCCRVFDRLAEVERNESPALKTKPAAVESYVTLKSLLLKYYFTGWLQLLEISWNLKTLLEILEIWNLIGPPGNFCVRCRRSTALVSSHKNVDKYSLQKYKIYAFRCVFCARQHICYSAYMLTPVRLSPCLSPCLSVTRVDQSKTI